MSPKLCVIEFVCEVITYIVFQVNRIQSRALSTNLKTQVFVSLKLFLKDFSGILPILLAIVEILCRLIELSEILTSQLRISLFRSWIILYVGRNFMYGLSVILKL